MYGTMMTHFCTMMTMFCVLFFYLQFSQEYSSSFIEQCLEQTVGRTRILLAGKDSFKQFETTSDVPTSPERTLFPSNT